MLESDVPVAEDKPGKQAMSQGTISVEEVIADYAHAYRLVYGHQPKAHYIGNRWYSVNGSTVHHTVIMNEIDYLMDLAKRQRRRGDRSTIMKLIRKLRLM
jgi:hypothetical protein